MANTTIVVDTKIQEENLKNMQIQMKSNNLDMDDVKECIDRKLKECEDCSNDHVYVVDENMNKMEKNLSQIQRFFHGKNVLITGATGFLGKMLVEKLLRSCPGVENLYLIVRQKRGKDIYTRVEEIFDDPVFERLKEEVPKFRHKIVVVPGDCEATGLGLTLTDRQMLIDKVNIIFHSAATVKFDEHLRAALNINVEGPLHLLRLAKDIKNLDVLMHVSTAYSNSHLTTIEEKFYPCDATCDQLHETIDKLTDKQIDDLLPTVLGPWPNTYTFTKALAEKELRCHSGSVPLGIFRPAIVISSAKEPLVCWTDNMYGPTGIVVGSATGVLRSLQCCSSLAAEIVPVDLVVSGLLAAANNVHCTYKNSPPPEPPIFNYVSTVENRITWGDFMAQNLTRVNQYPLSNAIWYISLTLHNSALMNQIYIFLLHLLPAALIDGLAMCIGRKPKMLKVYRKIHKFSSVLSYFCTREITFCNKNTRKLWEGTTEQDKKIFPFSMKQIDWNEYFEYYFLGIRRHIFKQTDDTLPQAIIKWRRLYYLHQIVRLIFIALAVYVIWSTLSLIW